MSKKKKQDQSTDDVNKAEDARIEQAAPMYRLLDYQKAMMGWWSVDAVQADKPDLLAGLETIKVPKRFKSNVQELPDTRDLTTYADAYASAVKKCQHPHLIDTLYGREFQCIDCGRYVDPREARGRWM